MKVVFLYTELAAYTLSCLDELNKRNVECHVFRYPVNKEAPFEFNFNSGVFFYDRVGMLERDIEQQIRKIGPSLIFCSGWIDKTYVKLCGKFRKKGVRTVLCLDNHWRLSLKQLMAVMVSPFFIKPNFTHAWVPGNIQRKFVSRLGFPQSKIYEGFYCADTTLFSGIFANRVEAFKENFPKIFLYTGRYYEFKGLPELWTAFIELKEESPDEWELWCVGHGDLQPVQHPQIRHFGFMQPARLKEIIAKAGVFVLPSRFEPWGVVVHEMAAAGLPLLLSSEVGAAEAFLAEGKNGLSFPANNKSELKRTLRKITSCTNGQLYRMGCESHELSKKISLQQWAETVLTINKN